jgi:hypothetical protein
MIYDKKGLFRSIGYLGGLQKVSIWRRCFLFLKKSLCENLEEYADIRNQRYKGAKIVQNYQELFIFLVPNVKKPLGFNFYKN